MLFKYPFPYLKSLIALRNANSTFEGLTSDPQYETLAVK
jgi:hypothetical protein